MSLCPIPETPPGLPRRLAGTPGGGERTSPCLRTPTPLRGPTRRACLAPRSSSRAGTCSRSRRQLWAGRSCGSSPESPLPLWQWWRRGAGRPPGRSGRPGPVRLAGHWAAPGPVVRVRALPVVRGPHGREAPPVVRARLVRARSVASLAGRGPDGARAARAVRRPRPARPVRQGRAVREARRAPPVRGGVRRPGRAVGRSAVRRPGRAVRDGVFPVDGHAALVRAAKVRPGGGPGQRAVECGRRGSDLPDANAPRRPPVRPRRNPQPGPSPGRSRDHLGPHPGQQLRPPRAPHPPSSNRRTTTGPPRAPHRKEP